MGKYHNTRRCPHDHLDLLILRRPRGIPGHITGPRGVFLHQRVHQLGDLFAPLNRFPAVLVHGSHAVGLRWLSGGGNHHRLSLGAPQGPQRGKPTALELIRVLEHIPSFQFVAGCFNRLFF